MDKQTTKKRQRIIRLLKTSILFLIVALVCAIAFGTAYIFGFDITSRLDPSQIYNSQQSTLVYDRTGTEIAVVHGLENRIWVPLSAIPVHVRNAFIAAEDVRFYSHSGIDIKRILGALVNDIKAGQLVEGASTITQQLIKNSLLNSKKVFSRKIEEALLAMELERRYSKDQILEMYLNYVYFGSNAYGIEAATRTFFNKPASELTLDEGAMLAGILKSTAHYAPNSNPEEAKGRRNVILGLMAEYGFISQEQAAQAKEVALKLSMQPAGDPYGFYLDAAMESAADILGITFEQLVSSGFRVYTSMDVKMQTLLEQAYRDQTLFPANAEDGTRVQSSSICIDPKTGYIMALMGARSYEVQRGLNRALKSKRQPGSVIKPLLVYAPALQSRTYSPVSVLKDEPKTFGQYTPKNVGDTYHGIVTMRQALVQSLNVPAVEILFNTGINSAKSFASSLGIKFGPGDNGLSIALGGFETGVTPLELCTGYSALASMGISHTPSFVTSIADTKGNVLYQAKDASKRVMSQETAFIVSDMLCDVVKSGTGKNLYMKDIQLCGKTGTNGNSNGTNRDIWMAAYNADLCAVVWMGFDKTDSAHSLPANATGGSYPAKLLKAVIAPYYKDKTAPQYSPPAGVRSVKLDRTALIGGEIKQAASYLLDKDIIEEYLYTDQDALVQNNALSCLVYGFKVKLNDSGRPVLSFYASSDIAKFQILRVSEGESEKVIANVDGEDAISFEDSQTQHLHGYTYSVQPVDENGQKMGASSAKLYIYVP